MASPCGLRANFANVLRRWRLEHRISRKMMAARLGFGLSTVRAWEMGTRFPTICALENVLTYTGISPCRLFCDRSTRCAPGQCLLLRRPA